MTLKELNEFAKKNNLDEDVHIMITAESVFHPDPESLDKGEWNGQTYLVISAE
jgi:hypothetical protein